MPSGQHNIPHHGPDLSSGTAGCQPTGVVYIYSYHQFDKPVVLNVAEEIAKAPPPGPMSKLFPEEVRQEAACRYQRALSNQDRCSQVGKAWVGSVLASLVLLILFSIRNPRGWIFWLPVMIILGPLGMLVWLIAEHKQKASSCQAALIEAIGHIPPIAVAYMVILAVFILVPQAQSSGPLQILFIFVLPLLLGWLFIQASSAARSMKSFASTAGLDPVYPLAVGAAWCRGGSGGSGNRQSKSASEIQFVSSTSTE